MNMDDTPIYNTPNPLPLSDTARWMLQRGIDEYEGRVPNTGWISESEVYNPRCYICKDPEFALMDMPLCYPCDSLVDGVVCGAHIPADDTVCDEGHDVFAEYLERNK